MYHSYRVGLIPISLSQVATKTDNIISLLVVVKPTVSQPKRRYSQPVLYMGKGREPPTFESHYSQATAVNNIPWMATYPSCRRSQQNISDRS